MKHSFLVFPRVSDFLRLQFDNIFSRDFTLVYIIRVLPFLSQ